MLYPLSYGGARSNPTREPDHAKPGRIRRAYVVGVLMVISVIGPAVPDGSVEPVVAAGLDESTLLVADGLPDGPGAGIGTAP